MESSQRTLSFASISGRKVEVDFDGGTTTSDAGALLLRQAESNIGIIDRVVAAMSDRRHPSYVDHTYTDLIRQRVFQIACGYEDANDSNDLRSDPGFKAACGRLPVSGADLASQPTMCRLENSVSRTDLYRIGLALLEGFIESYEQPPKNIILDIDDTDDRTHGAQQLSLFNAYHDQYCYLPVHLYEGTTCKLITTILRPGCRMRGDQAAAILKRVLDHLTMVWPQTRICLRGDSHFSTPEVHDLCDGYGIDFILGQAVNKRLKRLGAPLMALSYSRYSIDFRRAATFADCLARPREVVARPVAGTYRVGFQGADRRAPPGHATGGADGRGLGPSHWVGPRAVS